MSYTERIASTGLRREALIAGIMPAITPTATEMVMPVAMRLKGRMKLKSIRAPRPETTPHTSKSPTAPPMIHSATDSKRYCISMK